MKNYKELKALLIMLCMLSFCCYPHPLTAKKQQAKEKFSLSATAIFNNEAQFLREWIEYYRLLGVEHFYLYNNLSTDNYHDVLKPYVENGIVELIEWPERASNWGEWDALQVAAYRNAIERAKNETRWLAIIDIDEFIVPVKDDHLKTFLKKYENSSFGGICLMWSFFGTSNVEKIPSNKLMIESLVCHSGPASNGEISQVWNQGSYKSIVRPNYVNGIFSPHYCLYVEGRRHEMLPYEIIRINHYWTRDNDFFLNVKIPRRAAWGQESASALAWAAGMNGRTKNNPILRFVPKLRKKMGLQEEKGGF